MPGSEAIVHQIESLPVLESYKSRSHAATKKFYTNAFRVHMCSGGSQKCDLWTSEGLGLFQEFHSVRTVFMIIW